MLVKRYFFVLFIFIASYIVARFYIFYKTKNNLHNNADLKVDKAALLVKTQNSNKVKRSNKLQRKTFDNLISLNQTRNKFDFTKDVLVHLHIQKTSGTNWENNVYRYLLVNINSKWTPACKFERRRYICMKQRRHHSFYWDRYLISSCDIHASFSELENCVEQKAHALNGNTHFITFLRNPQNRYISEFHHVKRGATWFKAIRACNEQPIYKNKCYKNTDWKNVTWNEFLTCKYNLANNRQVRMLADYNELGCEALKCLAEQCSKEETFLYDEKLLESAKNTLRSLSFFGITEYQELSQYLFERTYESVFRFSVSLNQSNEIVAQNSLETQNEIEIKKLNALDNQLYDFAVTLFFKRVEYFKSKQNVQI